MKVYGDVEKVNLSTGERWQRVSGDGESVLQSCGCDRRLGPGEAAYPTADEIQEVADRIIAAVKSQEAPMSWSVSASGEPKEVAAKLEADFARADYLTGPEKEIKEAAAKLVMQTLAGYSGQKVSVSANGHAGINGDNRYQNLNITVNQIG